MASTEKFDPLPLHSVAGRELRISRVPGTVPGLELGRVLGTGYSPSPRDWEYPSIHAPPSRSGPRPAFRRFHSVFDILCPVPLRITGSRVPKSYSQLWPPVKEKTGTATSIFNNMINISILLKY